MVVCALARPATSAAAEATCAAYAAPPVVTGRVPAALPELSGLAASPRHPGVYWTHNDSGNALVLYAIREDGRLVGSFPLRGATAIDPEDVAVGPCRSDGSGSCIYLADTGDNLGTRSRVQLLRVEEPPDLRGRPLVATPLPFAYSDGAHDAEALLVDPRTAEAFVVTKTLFSLGTVYRIDALGAPGGGRAVRIRTIEAGDAFDVLTTGGSVHPDGARVLLRTYRYTWELRADGAERLSDVLAVRPVRVPNLRTGLGEAVGYVPDGLSYLLGGEGAGSPLARVRCR